MQFYCFITLNELKKLTPIQYFRDHFTFNGSQHLTRPAAAQFDSIKLNLTQFVQLSNIEICLDLSEGQKKTEK